MVTCQMCAGLREAALVAGHARLSRCTERILDREVRVKSTTLTHTRRQVLVVEELVVFRFLESDRWQFSPGQTDGPL